MIWWVEKPCDPSPSYLFTTTSIYAQASGLIKSSKLETTFKPIPAFKILSSSISLSLKSKMAFRLSGIVQAKKILRRSFSGSRSASSADVPKGYLAVYVGESQKRMVVPIVYLNQPAFQVLLNQAEEEFGFDHPNGGLTIPCSEDAFNELTSQFNMF
ncbi:unnamed protein product [Rhodiola kirilowii]